MKLSILIPSTHTRYNTFRPKIESELYRQYEYLNALEKASVEILVLSDNKKQMLGQKRNIMVDIAQGEYVVFVDDDDRVCDDYIKSLLNATSEQADVISFLAEVTINGADKKICDYSKDHKSDYNTSDKYFRIPNHICCVKKSVSLKSSFPNILYGEDSAYSKLLLPHLKTETKINEVLYYYDFNQETTETQTHIKSKIIERKAEPIVDVIILSNAKDSKLMSMTQQTINTCISGANGLSVNVIVIEQNIGATYQKAKTVHDRSEFNYNKRANNGAKMGTAEWIMIANNDLVFNGGWLHNLLIAGHDVVSPRCPIDRRQQDIKDNEIGDKCGRNLSGWCFMVKRSVWDRIGGFDEDFGFWCADNSFIEQLRDVGLLPMLVPSSIVRHLGSVTLRTVAGNEYNELTFRYVQKFNEKYGKDLFMDNESFKRWLGNNNVTHR